MKKQIINQEINDFDTKYIEITDERDVVEIKKRIKEQRFQPSKNELYSYNPDFDGNYKL